MHREELYKDMKWKKKTKRWHDNNCQRIARKKRIRDNYRKVSSRDNLFKGELLEAPNNFSLLNNTDETLKYFDDILVSINKKVLHQRIHIDVSAIEKVTVDALIYLIALMENYKLVKALNIKFSGNFPKNNEAKQVFIESGFLNYVNSPERRLPDNSSKIRIVVGKKNLSEVSKCISDFLIQEFKIKMKYTIFMQKILVELMSNSYHHAYPDDIEKNVWPKWYLYAEHIGEYVRIIFADTGKGITGTVRKKLREKILRYDDSLIIESSFDNDSFIRTETKMDYRGNGLPGIKEILRYSPIGKMNVISGKGKVSFINYNGILVTEKKELKNKILGTIYVFECREGDLIDYAKN